MQLSEQSRMSGIWRMSWSLDRSAFASSAERSVHYCEASSTGGIIGHRERLNSAAEGRKNVCGPGWVKPTACCCGLYSENYC